MKKLVIALVGALFVPGAVSPVAAQEAGFASRAAAARSDAASMTTARELYAAARYDEALAVLNGLRGREGSPAETKVIEQYRSLCLLALGRAEEAEAAIAAVVTADPFFAPTESEASPRVRAAFSDVRNRLLPGLVTAHYAAAKQAYDRREHAVAEKMFRELITLLDDPQMRGRMPDLRVLAAGFLDLAAAAAAPPPAPKPEPKPEPPAPPAPVVPVPPRVYTGDEPGIVAPATIRQELPKIPAAITGLTKDKGVLDLTIDEQGRVITMTLRSSIHPMYDTMLLGAVKEWKYRPATLNGKPVRFRKVLQVTLPASR